MGAVAAWASLAIAAGSAAYGVKQNSDAAKENEGRYNESKADYANRLAMAGQMASQLNKEYNSIVANRPDMSWESFVRDKIKAINDPYLRQFYTQAKSEDFAKMKEFADEATNQNSDNLIGVADKLSGGKFREILAERDKLVMNTDAASRMARAHEISAPMRTNADTVKYDSEGRLVEGQRADKQVFDIAQEVVTATEQEKKSDLRQLEVDRIGAAQSSVQKASDFMGFFDATGYATAIESDRSDKLYGFQALDEERSFRLYEMLAGASAGITATQPSYVPSGPGNALIQQGVSTGASALSTYNASQKNKSANTTY